MSLFDPVITLEVPDAFADEVAKHRTTVTSPSIDGDGVPGPGPVSDPNDPLGNDGQDAPGEITETASIDIDEDPFPTDEPEEELEPESS